MVWRFLIAAAIAAGLLAWWGGAFEGLEPQALASGLRNAGPWAWLLFVAGLALTNGLGLPAAPFVLTAIAVWSPFEAFLLLWVGAVAAGLVGYAFARGLGRSWVEPRLPATLRGLDRRIARHELRTVVLVRATLYLLGPSHWALGLSSVRPLPLLVGSLLGFLPGSIFWALAGGELVQAMSDGSGGGWIALGVLAVVALVLPRWWARRRARQRAQERSPAGSDPGGDGDTR